MKLGRFTSGGPAFWAAVDTEAGTARPLAGRPADWGPALTADPETSLPWRGSRVDLDTLKVLAPLDPAAKVLAAGATYAKHIAGMGLQMPTTPAAFLKTQASIIGPGDDITYPRLTTQLDYEAELVVVIGAPVSGGGASAITSVLGYTIGNEVSARDLQFGGGVTGMDMFSAKALDGTGPVGPFIVTRDEFGDEHPDLEIILTIDGEVRQRDRTSSLAWSIGEIVSYVAERSRLLPGDVLFTGTPAGVGHEDGRYLEPGQEVVVTISRLGELRNVVGPRQN